MAEGNQTESAVNLTLIITLALLGVSVGSLITLNLTYDLLSVTQAAILTSVALGIVLVGLVLSMGLPFWKPRTGSNLPPE